MKILALMKYGSLAASTRQRLVQYEPFLANHGITVEHRALLGNDHMTRLAQGRRASLMSTARGYAWRLVDLVTRSDHDVIWVHKELFPYLPGIFERLARASGKPVVYDFDDAIFHQYDTHRSPIVRALLARKLKPILSHASAAIAGNQYLADYAAQYCPNTVVIPTVVDSDRYRPGPATDGERVTIGWIGSPSTWTYVIPYLPMLTELAAREDVAVRVVGAGPRADGLAGVESIAWREATEIAEVQRMDIGIMPLPDEEWARGKCGFKLIQYMACGLPVIASPVGVNGEIVEHGVNGFLASSPEEWRTALTRLIEDPALRRRMGDAGRERAVERYSLAAHAPRLLALLQAIA